jgi:hypothetical protein
MRRAEFAFLVLGGVASTVGITACRDHHEDILVDAAASDARPDVQNIGGAGGASSGLGGEGGGAGADGTAGAGGAGGAS